MLCSFCPNPAVATCFWPVERWVDVRVVDLRVDDTVMAGKRIGRVYSVEECTLHVAVGESGLDWKTYHYSRFTSAPVATKREAPCGHPVCEAHLQERAEGKVICMEHWKAWEKAA